jgi:hypothetical protein
MKRLREQGKEGKHLKKSARACRCGEDAVFSFVRANRIKMSCRWDAWDLRGWRYEKKEGNNIEEISWAKAHLNSSLSLSLSQTYKDFFRQGRV